MLKIAKEELLNENNSTWRRGVFELYINHHKDMDLIRDEAVKIIEDYLKS